MPRKSAFPFTDPRAFDFSAAPIYFKIAALPKARVELVRAPQTVVTRFGKLVETRNVARRGDRIITGPQGERYVMKARQFANLYDRDPKRPDRFVSKGRVRALKLKENVELLAPWGEKQRARKGAYVVQRVGKARDIYLIEERAFKKTYRRERAAPRARPAVKPRAKK